MSAQYSTVLAVIAIHRSRRVRGREDPDEYDADEPQARQPRDARQRDADPLQYGGHCFVATARSAASVGTPSRNASATMSCHRLFQNDSLTFFTSSRTT